MKHINNKINEIGYYKIIKILENNIKTFILKIHIDYEKSIIKESRLNYNSILFTLGPELPKNENSLPNLNLEFNVMLQNKNYMYKFNNNDLIAFNYSLFNMYDVKCYFNFHIFDNTNYNYKNASYIEIKNKNIDKIINKNNFKKIYFENTEINDNIEILYDENYSNNIIFGSNYINKYYDYYEIHDIKSDEPIGLLYLNQNKLIYNSLIDNKEIQNDQNKKTIDLIQLENQKNQKNKEKQEKQENQLKQEKQENQQKQEKQENQQNQQNKEKQENQQKQEKQILESNQINREFKLTIRSKIFIFISIMILFFLIISCIIYFRNKSLNRINNIDSELV